MNEKPPPDKIKYIIENSNEPFVFHNITKTWSWDLNQWAEKFTEKIPFRTGKFKYTKEPQWERNTHVELMTFKQFIDLAEKSTNNWYYFDYIRISTWFNEDSDLMKNISWADFGYPNKDGRESVIWIGSKGAHTPCHLDTYGYNLVHQIYGQKRWILFPPESNGLQPTRVPYEESSIFSQLNFFSPDVNQFKGVSRAKTVLLNPGDVLFVPKQWWHYVENVSPIAISINIWIPLNEDDEMRLQESIIQLLMANLVKDLHGCEKNMLINPNFDDITETSFFDYFNQLKICCERQISVNKNKKIKTDDETILENQQADDTKMNTVEILDKYTDYIKQIPTLTSPQFQQLIMDQQKRFGDIETREENGSKIVKTDHVDIKFMQKFINSLCHPEVIDLISKKLINE